MDTIFQPSLGIFLNREYEIEKFEELIKGKMPNQRLFQIHGISGQGKTELVRKACKMALSNDIIPSYIDFEEGKFQTADILPILEKLTEQIFKKKLEDKYLSFNYLLNSFFEEFSIFKNDFFRDPLKADKSEVNSIKMNLFNVFRCSMIELLEKQNRKIIICLDSIEKAFPDALKSFEKEIINHIISYQNLYIIVAGQRLYSWKEYAVQNQIFSISLNRFDESHTLEFIRILSQNKDIDIQHAEKYIFEKTWELTLGHPYYTYKFLDLISEGASNELTQDIIDIKYQQTIEIIIENFIYEQLPENWKKHENISALKKLFLLLAPLRHIEFGTFQYIIDTFIGDDFYSYTTFDFQTLMGNLLNDTYLFVYNDPGFNMEEATRNIILTYLKSDQYDLYIRMLKTLADKYDFWVATSSDRSQIKNIIEHIYNTIKLQILQENNIDEHVVQNKIDLYLKTYFNLKNLKSKVHIIEQCNRLKNGLINDNELKALINIEPIIVLIDSHLKDCVDVLESCNIPGFGHHFDHTAERPNPHSPPLPVTPWRDSLKGRGE